jgi:hypothetical protein
LKVFPNPTADSFTVEITPSPSKQNLSIYDMQGKLLKQVIMVEGQLKYVVHTSHWKNGEYIVSLNNGTKEVATQRIVISH